MTWSTKLAQAIINIHCDRECKDNVVLVKSWKPWFRGPHGIEWPTVLCDHQGYMRQTITPVWDWVVVKRIWREIWLGKRSQ